MNKIKEIKLDQTNWLEITFIDEDNKEIHCESFGDSDEYQALLKQRCNELNSVVTDELETIILEQRGKRKVFTAEEIAEIDRLVEKERVASIKAEASSIIQSKYSIVWQLNHPRLDITYSNEYDWIDNIRKISNEAEANGTKPEDINWEV